MVDFWSTPLVDHAHEWVGLVAFSPKHFKGEEIDMTVLLLRDQLKENSLSACRLACTAPHQITENVARPSLSKLPPKTNYPRGVLIALAGDIADIPTNGGAKAFKISRDGTRENPGHITIGFSAEATAEGLTKSVSLSLRSELEVVFFGNDQCLPQTATSASWCNSGIAIHPAAPQRWATGPFVSV